MEPTDQRLDRDHRAVVKPDLRLVVDDQLAAFQRLAQLGLEDQALEGARVHVGRVELVTAARMLLGPIERGIRIADQGLGVIAVVGIDGDAETGTKVQLLVIDLERRQEGVEDLLGDLGGVLGAVDAGQQEQEIIGAEPCHGIAPTHGADQTLADRAQDLIAAREPERIVDQLEAVEVEDHDREQLLAAPRPLDRLGQTVIEQQAVGQAGQRIVVGEVADRLLGVFADCDVTNRQDVQNITVEEDFAGRELQSGSPRRPCAWPSFPGYLPAAWRSP